MRLSQPIEAASGIAPDIGIAIVGTGTVAERHAKAIAALGGGSLTAVYDSSGDIAERYTYTPYGRRTAYESADVLDTYGTKMVVYSQSQVTVL